MRPAAVLSAIVKVQGIKTANVALYGMQAQLMKTDAVATGTMGRMGKLGTVMKTGVAGAAILTAYGLSKAASAGATFNERLDATQAVTKASGKQMERLRKQALKFGETTVFSANSAAEAQKELAKGGLTVAQIYRGGLKSALYLASAGEIELGESAEFMANSMNLFGLKGKESIQVANGLAIAANDTTAEVRDFGWALKQSGGVAKLVGYNFQEALTGLEALAKSGYKNSDAGTSMKTALIQLVKPSKKQSELTKELGLNWETNTGALKSAVEISSELRKKTKDMTETQRGNTLATLGGTDGVRYLNALWEAGPKLLGKYEAKLKSDGYAKEVAATKTDNLKGDLKKLGNAFEVVGIKVETAAEPIARDLVQALADAAVAVSNFDLGEFIGEIEHAYEVAHDATKINFAGAEFSIFPEVQEVEESGQWLQNATTNTFTAVVAGYQWLETASINTFKAVVASFNWVIGAFEDFGSWVVRAWNNVVGFVGSLIPVKLALIAVYIAMQPVIGIIEMAWEVLEILWPILVRIAKFFISNWVAALKVAWTAIQVFLKFVGNIGAVVGDVVAVVSNLLRGDFKGAWEAAKRLVVDVWHTVIDVLKGGWTIIKSIFSAGGGFVSRLVKTAFGTIKEVIGGAAKLLGTAFKAPWETVEGLFTTALGVIEGVVNTIIDVINLIPGVDIKKFGEADKTGVNLGKKKGATEYGKHAMGGKITKPIAIMGEEAPMHHEWVIATNPAYKKQNLGYWAKAGEDLGVPGFAGGGMFGGMESLINIPSPGDVAGTVGDVAKKGLEYSPGGLAYKAGKKGLEYGMDLVAKGAGFLINKLPKPNVPFPLEGVGPYVINKAEEYIKSWFGSDAAKKYRDAAKTSSAGGSNVDLGKATGNLKAAMSLAIADGLEITSTTGGTHTPTSFHYLGRAFDASNSSGPTPEMMNYFNDAASRWGSSITELFYDPAGFYIKYGKKITGAIGDHSDHVHTAFAKGGLFKGIAKFAKGGVLGTIATVLGNGGLDLEAIAGIAGNAYGESGLNPASEGSGGKGLWGFTASPVSPADLDAFAASQGTAWTDAKTQSQFLYHHLGIHDSEYIKKLNAMKTPAETATSFMRDWEKPELEDSLGKRIAKAEQYYGELKGGKFGSGDGKLTDAQEKKREEAQRLKNREGQLKKLRSEVGEQKTDRARRAKLWQLMKFWGRNGVFDKDERAHILGNVNKAASTMSIDKTIGILSDTAKYSLAHGELTGKEPDEWGSLIDAMNKAQEKGDKVRDREIDRFKKKKERIKNEKIASIAARGEMPVLIGALEAYRKATDASDEYAGQLGSLEPENLTDDYVKGEQSAWRNSLGLLGSWRNTAVKGKDYVNDKIAYLKNDIGNIETFKPPDSAKARKTWDPKWTKRYNENKWRIKPLREAIATAEEVRDKTLVGELDELSPQTREGIYDQIGDQPIAGMFGGRIFDTQNTIWQLGLSGAGNSAASEAAQLQAEIDKTNAMNWKKRFITSQYQQDVIKNFPTVGDLGSLPGYALGGRPYGPSWVGERGKELFLPDRGGRVVSAHESSEIMRDSAGTIVVAIDQITIYEDGTADVTVGGETTAAEVRNVTRKDTRGALAPTPGGTRR